MRSSLKTPWTWFDISRSEVIHFLKKLFQDGRHWICLSTSTSWYLMVEHGLWKKHGQVSYAAVIYNNCTRGQSNRLESCQRKAAVACTRSYQKTNTTALLQELGWPKLETRRNFLRHILILKMANGIVPEYLKFLLTPSHDQARKPGGGLQVSMDALLQN
jgi:hypothetical protein